MDELVARSSDGDIELALDWLAGGLEDFSGQRD